jgi:transcriptional regulator with XRE-family HTH domain
MRPCAGAGGGGGGRRRRDPGLDGAMREFGSFIARLREELGLSQSDLAELVGLHVNTLANIERAAVDPSVLTISLILVKLGCSGVEVSERGFEPLPPSAGSGLPAFPALEAPPPSMVRMMGGLVRSRRLALGLSLDQAARASGVHRNTYWNFEKGLVAPSLSTTYRVYLALGIKRVLGCEEGIRFY